MSSIVLQIRINISVLKDFKTTNNIDKYDNTLAKHKNAVECNFILGR